METLLAAALLLSQSETLSQSVPEQPPASIEVPVEAAPSETDNLEIPLTCGPNQFPSAFSDVYPTDWAYQAVNRLASRSMQCFDYPLDRLLEQ